MIWNIAIQIVFLILNDLTAKYQAKLFRENESISHWKWALGYFILSAATYFINHEILLPVALIVQRLPVFNWLLNHYRNLPWNYLGSKSVLDRLMKRNYPLFFWAAIVLLITLEIIMFI